jgi:hypothetical protein
MDEKQNQNLTDVEWIEDDEDGEFLAKSGDEPNYRIIGGEWENITRPDEQIHEAGGLYIAKMWYYRCYLLQVDEFERGIAKSIPGETAAEKCARSTVKPSWKDPTPMSNGA